MHTELMFIIWIYSCCSWLVENASLPEIRTKHATFPVNSMTTHNSWQKGPDRYKMKVIIWVSQYASEGNQSKIKRTLREKKISIFSDVIIFAPIIRRISVGRIILCSVREGGSAKWCFLVLTWIYKGFIRIKICWQWAKIQFSNLSQETRTCEMAVTKHCRDPVNRRDNPSGLSAWLYIVTADFGVITNAGLRLKHQL